MLRQGAGKNHNAKPQVVEFSNLDNNNKAEFLEFLLRNNITFETNGSSKNDFVAKITIQKPEAGKQKENSSKQPSKIAKEGLKPRSKGLHVITQNSLQANNRIGTPKKQKVSTPNHQTSVIKNSGTPLKQKKVGKQVIKTNNGNENSYNRTEQSKVILTNNKNRQINDKVKTTAFEANELSKSIHKSPAQRKRMKNDESSISKDKSGRINKASCSVIKAQKPNSGRDKYIQNYGQNQDYSVERIPNQANTNKSIQILTSGPVSKKGVIVTKQKKIEANNQIKKKTEEEKEVSELAKKYLKLFQLKLLGQRPIRWGLSQLLKVIQQIYNDLFIKNTQILSQQKNQKKQPSCKSFPRFIKQWFANKFKNQKLATTNLINLLYSLSYYTQSEKKLVTTSKNFVKQERANHELTVSGIFLQTFEDFLCEIYQYEDLLFFLFVRNIVINQVSSLNNLSLTKVKLEKESKLTLIEKQIILTYEDIQKILSIIFVDDNELIQQYKSIVLNYIHCININMKGIQNVNQIQNQIKLSGPNFMYLLLQDYRSKRVSIQKDVFEQVEYKISKTDFQSFKSQNTFQELIHNQFLPSKKQYDEKSEKRQNQSGRHVNFNENETVQLTFGEDTQSNMQKLLDTQNNFDLCRSFWQISEQNNLLNKLESSSVEYLIYEKLRKKIKQFISMLSEGKSQNNSIDEKKLQSLFLMKQKQLSFDPKAYVIEVFSKKASSLLSSLFEMNKIRWFEQLKVDDPSQQDIDKVEELQLMYRKLKSSPEAEGIGRLCKNIITIPQLMSALEKIICI